MKRLTELGRIGVLMGGYSSERDISLKSGRAISAALKGQGFDVCDVDITVKEEDKIFSMVAQADIQCAFVALHGELGEDGVIQSICEKIGIPYTGSGVRSSQISFNKISSHKVFSEHDIPIPEYTIVRTGKDQPLTNISFPVVVKPACEGSSIGITIVSEESQLDKAVKLAFEYGDELLIERCIEGRELTVGILNEQPLPIVEIQPPNNFFDFSAKYNKGMTKYIVPAEIPQELAVDIQSLGLQAHQALECCDYSRVDLVLDQQMKPFVLEVNTVPGFTETSLLPMAAQEVGVDFSQLCTTLIQLAYAKTN